MEDKKINPLLTGSAETMLQSFYARAKYSRKKNAKFYDAKAIELVGKIDYDFSKAEKDSTMSNGVIARTIVFDELVKDFIKKNPDCTVVNIACGLDTRFYRMDNGRIIWYNVDLPETIELRDAIYHESGRVSTIGISATDPAWADKVTKRGKMLIYKRRSFNVSYLMMKTLRCCRLSEINSIMRQCLWSALLKSG